MATPPDSPIEEVVYELETAHRLPKPIPVALEDLCRQTKFSRQEIRVMYRGFKTVSSSDAQFSTHIFRSIKTKCFSIIIIIYRNVQKEWCRKIVSKIFMQNFFHTEVCDI